MIKIVVRSKSNSCAFIEESYFLAFIVSRSNLMAVLSSVSNRNQCSSISVCSLERGVLESTEKN